MPTSIDSVDALLAAARAAGLDLTTTATELDTTGLDFLVVHAHDAAGVPWIVRTPRRPDVVVAAAREARVLALVAPRLPVAVPDWRVHTDDVIAYPRLPGTPAVTIDAAGGPTWNLIDPAAPSDAFLDGFAAAVAALAAIPTADAAQAGVPVHTIADTRAAFARAADATRAALAPSDATWARWQRWLADDASWPTHAALVHGDLHPGHLLLDDGGRLTGVLDWTEAHIGDPSIDLAMFVGCFGRPALERLLPRLVARGLPTWPRLVDHCVERWHAFPVLGAEWALRTGNDAVLAHARSHLTS
ncbi:MAG TPA: macrolide 2'-phosphotransferase [Kofleriaceae bacterium]|nr:macrolide 2'-phosphotransferase [Kofleriaceae bacterium]